MCIRDRGKVVQKDKKFYLNVEGEGSFEMGLLSEGYKKLATIVYLIQSGSLSKGSILFWDEPETNMNPKMVEPVAQALGCLLYTSLCLSYFPQILRGLRSARWYMRPFSAAYPAIW